MTQKTLSLTSWTSVFAFGTAFLLACGGQTASGTGKSPAGATGNNAAGSAGEGGSGGSGGSGGTLVGGNHTGGVAGGTVSGGTDPGGTAGYYAGGDAGTGSGEWCGNGICEWSDSGWCPTDCPNGFLCAPGALCNGKTDCYSGDGDVSLSCTCDKDGRFDCIVNNYGVGGSAGAAGSGGYFGGGCGAGGAESY